MALNKSILCLLMLKHQQVPEYHYTHIQKSIKLKAGLAL